MTRGRNTRTTSDPTGCRDSLAAAPRRNPETPSALTRSNFHGQQRIEFTIGG